MVDVLQGSLRSTVSFSGIPHKVCLLVVSGIPGVYLFRVVVWRYNGGIGV